MNLASSITDQAQLTALNSVTGALSLVIYVITAIAVWRVFTKAGYPGWLALIPIVNAIYLIKIAGLSGWFVLLYIVPIANVVLAIIVALRTGKAFGHGAVFSFFLLFLPGLHIIGYFILGFGSDTYDRSRATL